MVTIWFYFINNIYIEYLRKKCISFKSYFPTIEGFNDYTLYAYTTDEDIAKCWKEQRSNVFIEQVHDKPVDFYNYLKSNFGHLEISWIKMNNYKKTVKVLSTYMEKDYINLCYLDYILPEEIYFSFHPELINSISDEYRSALRNLGVNTLIIIDNINHNMNKNILDIIRNNKDYFWDTSVKLRGKEINLFFHIFFKLFYNKKEDIS